MIEASRIDHAGHANDAAGHIHDTVMYNEVMAFVKGYIDSHPDTQLLSAADHECGGLTLENNYNPAILQAAKNTPEALGPLFESHEGDKAEYLKNELMPRYGLTNITDEDVQMLLDVAGEKSVDAMGIAAGKLLAAAAGLNWATEDHTAVDVLLHGYANERSLKAMKELMGKNNDNTELAKYVEKALGLNLLNATRALRANGSDWVAKRDELHIIKRTNSMHIHRHN